MTAPASLDLANVVRAVVQSGDTALDVACGDGALAVAAARAGARGVLALDNAPEALAAAGAAVRAAGLEHVVRVAYGELAAWPLIPVRHCFCQLSAAAALPLLPRLATAVRGGLVVLTRVEATGAGADAFRAAAGAAGLRPADAAALPVLALERRAPVSGAFEPAWFHA